jgi:hypothetical protein
MLTVTATKEHYTSFATEAEHDFLSASDMITDNFELLSFYNKLPVYETFDINLKSNFKIS